MKTVVALCLLLLAGCARHIALEPSPAHSARILLATCPSGEPAVDLWEVRYSRNESRRFRARDKDGLEDVFLRPGAYQVEAGCNRGKTQCGRMKGWLHIDGAPTTRFTVEAGDELVLDCNPETAELVLRR